MARGDPPVLSKHKASALVLRQGQNRAASQRPLEGACIDGGNADAEGLPSFRADLHARGAGGGFVDGDEIHAHGRLPWPRSSIVGIHGGHPVEGGAGFVLLSLGEAFRGPKAQGKECEAGKGRREKLSHGVGPPQ